MSPECAETKGVRPQRPPAAVTAVVLTHKRPGLAGDVVRSLLGVEGVSPSVWSWWSTAKAAWTIQISNRRSGWFD